MGLDFDPTKYGMKDYAAEFAKKADEYKAYNRGRMDALGIGTDTVTVPIGNTKKQTVDYEAGWLRYTPRAFNSQQIAQDINFTNDAMQLNKQAVYTYRDGKKNKEAINAAIDEVTKLFIQYGTEHGTEVKEKDAKDLAKRFVENELNKENFLSTRTFVDEAAYKKAEQDREIQKKGLVSQYMREDSTLSKKDAERRADASLVRNQLLKNKGAIKYINEHKDYFYDEQGNLSQEKYKAAVLGFMNAHTADDEVDNYRLSLNERYDLAAKFGINDNSMCDMVHRAGGGFQKDYKELKQALIMLLGAGVGYGAGALLNVAASTATKAAANAAANGAASSATAGAGALVTVEGAEYAGSALGAGLAANIRLKSEGEDAPVYGPGKPKEEPPVPPNEEPHEEPQVCELTPDESHEVVQAKVPTCEYPVLPGDNWSKVALAKYQVDTGKVDEDGQPVLRPVTKAEAYRIGSEIKRIVYKKQASSGEFFKPFSKVVIVNGKKQRMYVQDLIEKGLLTEEDKESEAYKNSLMTLPEEFDGLYAPELKGMKFVVDCNAFTDGKRSEGRAKGKQGTIKDAKPEVAQRDYNIDQYWFTDCSGNKSNIFSTKPPRDEAMAEEQARRNQANK